MKIRDRQDAETLQALAGPVSARRREVTPVSGIRERPAIIQLAASRLRAV